MPLVTSTAGVVLWVMRMIGTEREAREKLAKEFADYRERVAREFVTRETLERMEVRVLDSINRLGDRLDRVLSTTTIIAK
jgi:hypothetical protein